MAASAPQPLRLCGITVPNNDVHKNKELALSAASQNPNFVEKAVLVSQNALWENGKILDYSFFGGTQMQRAKVEDVIQEWTWYANITFRRSTDNNAQATLRIAFDPTKGSWSYVGNTAKSCVGPAPTINLGWISDTDTLTKKERGVILHEFGHVLGLMHEHESPARSGVLRLKEKEIIQYYTETQGWDEATVRKQVLDVYSMESVSNYSQFDPTSIMMYFMPGSMNEGGVDIHEVTELSMLDKAFIVANYPRSTPHPRAQQWTPGFALVAAGARPDTITAYDRTTDVDEKRSIFTRDMIDRRLLDNKPHGQTAVQRAPNVQTGFNTSFKPSPSSDDKFIQDILNQLNFGGPKAAFKKPDGVQHAVQAAHAEMVQNGILGMLLQIAPMVLLAPNIPALGSSQVAHAVLDPNNLSLEHPVVQHGLLNFFSKLASNETVKKVMAGAVKVAGGVVSDFVGNIFPQNALDTSALDPQNGLLTDGFAMLVRKVVAHPIFQDAVKDIAGVTNHSGVQHLAYNNLAYTEPQNAVQFAVHSEKVQNGILSLLLGIAPKVLLAPNIPASGPSEVSHAVLDPHNLSLEHPVVQHGLMNFFTTLASNDIVKKVMAGAVKVAGGVVSDLVGNLIPQTQNAFNTQNVFSTQNANYTQNAFSTQNANYNYNANTQNAFNTQNANNDQDAFNTTIFEPQNGIIGDGLAAQGYQASDPTELAFKQRMNKTLTEIWRRGGPTAGEHILRHMERVLENPV